jgi:hypothetical protein
MKNTGRKEMKKFFVLAMSLAAALVLMTSCGKAPTAPVATPTIASATDTDYTVTTGGTGTYSGWYPQTSTSYDGIDAAQSGECSNNSSTWFQITVSGADYVDFYWKVSSESFDHLTVYVDGSQKSYISGITSWSYYSILLPDTGTHTVRWSYSKDGSIASGADAAWVDQISVY